MPVEIQFVKHTLYMHSTQSVQNPFPPTAFQNVPSLPEFRVAQCWDVLPVKEVESLKTAYCDNIGNKVTEVSLWNAPVRYHSLLSPQKI